MKFSMEMTKFWYTGLSSRGSHDGVSRNDYQDLELFSPEECFAGAHRDAWVYRITQMTIISNTVSILLPTISAI